MYDCPNLRSVPALLLTVLTACQSQPDHMQPESNQAPQLNMQVVPPPVGTSPPGDGRWEVLVLPDDRTTGWKLPFVVLAPDIDRWTPPPLAALDELAKRVALRDATGLPLEVEVVRCWHATQLDAPAQEADKPLAKEFCPAAKAYLQEAQMEHAPVALLVRPKAGFKSGRYRLTGGQPDDAPIVYTVPGLPDQPRHLAWNNGNNIAFLPSVLDMQFHVGPKPEIQRMAGCLSADGQALGFYVDLTEALPRSQIEAALAVQIPAEDCVLLDSPDKPDPVLASWGISCRNTQDAWNKPWKVQFDNGKLPGALAIWPGIDAASLAIMPQEWPSPYSKQCFRIEFL